MPAGVVVVVVAVVTIAGMAGRHRASGSEPFVGPDLHSLVADPTTPGRVFVGGHEGVAVSGDNAHTSMVEASPADPNVGYGAGLDGTHARVWISRDAGTTWQRS